jgi:hypothetical protein
LLLFCIEICIEPLRGGGIMAWMLLLSIDRAMCIDV